MPRWCSGGCLFLPCTQKKVLAVKDDDPLEDDIDFSVKNELLDFTKEDLTHFTGQFSDDNLVGVSEFGKLYRGKMPMGLDNDTTKDICVKILHSEIRHPYMPNDLTRLEDELKFLQVPSIMGNINLVKLIGCCREDKFLGVVYDLNPRDTLHNVISRDDFNWLQRVKVALALARLLNILHNRVSPYQICNINPAHIVVDQDFNPVLFDLGMVVGKVLDKPLHCRRIAVTFGYTDPSVSLCGYWSVKCDVYSFGSLLLNLMTKRLTNLMKVELTHVGWALEEYKHGCSLVHPSLEGDPNFDPRDGPVMTDLAMKCIVDEWDNRPQMKEVVKCLEALHVLQGSDSPTSSAVNAQ